MDKLQELTDRLYNEGLSKGKAEGEALLSAARKEAGEITEAARREAEGIIAAAEKKAAEIASKAEGDTRMASQQALQATRKDIENLVVAKIADTEVKNALSAPEFLKGIITEVAKNFSAQEQKDFSLILPESLKSALEPFVKNELGKVLGKGVEVTFSKKTAGGFSIGPADGGYFISLTDDTFRSLISEYLRPSTRKLLFGE